MDGQFTGMMGQIQREEVHIGAPAGPTSARLTVMGFGKAVSSKGTVIISLKPSVLSQHFLLSRPFAGKSYL